MPRQEIEIHTKRLNLSVSIGGELDRIQQLLREEVLKLRELMQQMKVLKDRVRGVVHGKYNGLYLYGRAGTAKTFTVRTTRPAAMSTTLRVAASSLET